MAGKIRTFKPEFFQHDELFELEQETGLPVRLAFAGLWTQCDREGRFEWKPRFLKLQILPYDDVDFGEVLDALASRGFVAKYDADSRCYGCVPSFTRHQVINNRESGSKIPAPPDPDACCTRPSRVDDASGTREGREGHATQSCTSGTGTGTGTGINTPLPPKGGGDLPEVDESPKPRKSSRRHQGRDGDPPGFPEFYAKFRRQEARKVAAEKYPAAVQKLAKAGKSPDDASAFLLARASEYAASVQDRPVDKTLLPSTWLNQERWNDALPQPASPQSAVPATNAMAQPSGIADAPLLEVTADEATDPAAFDGWFDRQRTFDQTERNRKDFHALRCSVHRILRRPEVARNELNARIAMLAAGRQLVELPRREDIDQAARDLAQLAAGPARENAPAESRDLLPIGGAA